MADRWDRIQDLYHRALERNDAERERFVAEACLGDDELRQEVESLLGYASAARRVMEPAAESPRIENGRQIGSYKMTSLLGVGGMGEVYRARDLKLERDVAIKVLPHSFSSDPERVRRFEREARSLAALNHPDTGLFSATFFRFEPDLIRRLVAIWLRIRHQTRMVT